MVTGRNPAALADLAALGLLPVAMDLGVPDLSARLVRALDGFQPDVLVNAGTVAPPCNFCDMAESDIHRSLTTNLTQALPVTRAVAPGMRTRGSGHIFFTASIAGHMPYPKSTSRAPIT